MRKNFHTADWYSLILSASCLLSLPAGCGISDITLPQINQPPKANPGADRNVDVGERVTLSALGSTDPDGDPLTYHWQQRSGASVTLDRPNSAQATFVPVSDGSYEFALTVTDSRGGSDTSTVSVFVGDTPPTCPRADAGEDQTVNEGSAVTLRGGNSADPGGSPLSYEWFQLSGPQASINGIFNAEPSFAAPQVTGSDIVLEFELRVTNDQGCDATDTVTITVRDRPGPTDPCSGVVCPDDGLFCNGVEICERGICVSSGDPCPVDTFCNESTDRCDVCLVDAHCDDGDLCTDDACVNGTCTNTAMNCDDNDACTVDACVNGICLNTAIDCDDGLFCNGEEMCDAVSGACVEGIPPCATDETCDEDTDQCTGNPGCGAAGEPCLIDYELQNGMQFIAHGPGACENTGTEPGPSFEFFDTSLPAIVSPGQAVTFSVDWNRCSDCNPNAVIYSSFAGDWDIDQPLQVSNAYFTTCEQTATDSVSFTAPTEPGVYRMRWIMCFAFDAIRNFCGESFTGNAFDPGTCPYIQRTFTVTGCSGSLQISKHAQEDTGCRASGIVLSPDGTLLYAACWESPPDRTIARVLEYSLPDLTLLQTILTSSNHGDVVVSGDGSRIFVPEYYPATITQIELRNANSMTNLSTVDTWPASIARTPDQRKVIVGAGQDGRSYDMVNDSIAIYDISGGAFSLLESVVLQDEPAGLNYGISQDSRFAYVPTRRRQSSNPKLYEVSLKAPFGITRTLDFPEVSLRLENTETLGNQVYVSDSENKRIWVVDRTSWTKVGYVIESAPTALRVHPSGAYLFALLPDVHSVIALDVASMSVVSRYDGLSASPSDIEFNNDGTRMYVTHRSSAGEVMVFDLSW